VIVVTGLGPGDFDRIPGSVQTILLDPARTVIVRTRSHPAAEQLAARREVVFCDDLYESLGNFESVYDAIVERVITTSQTDEVVYAVPGSPLVGEFAVRQLLASGVEVELIPAESFVDAVLAEVGYDPFDRGLQILNGHSLPDPLVVDKPTIVGHLDRPEILAEVVASLARMLPEDAQLTVLAGLGDATATVVTTIPEEVDPGLAGFRTSIFVDAPPGGLIGAVQAMRVLRAECPWDQEQTHQSLVKYLVEESNELIDAIARLGEDDVDVDLVAYAAVEDELGDVLLNVLFHAAIAREAGAFDIDDVGEVLRQKLVRRHPHVFGEVEVDSADEVKANWDLIKAAEKGDERESTMDGIPTGMSGLHRASKVQNRAAKVGFDWSEAAEVLPTVRGEVDELEAVMADSTRSDAELGDVLFSVVNLARHLGLDPELSLRKATDRFERRFRHMEDAGTLVGLDLDQLNDRWERAKTED